MKVSHSANVQNTLDRLTKLDDQLSRGLVTRQDIEAQRLVALFDLIAATEEKDPYAFNQPW
jgi:ribosomal protein S6